MRGGYVGLMNCVFAAQKAVRQSYLFHRSMSDHLFSFSYTAASEEDIGPLSVPEPGNQSIIQIFTSSTRSARVLRPLASRLANLQKVPIDVLTLPPPYSNTQPPIFLQQASHLTEGVYWRWNGKGALLEYLHVRLLCSLVLWSFRDLVPWPYLYLIFSPFRIFGVEM